MWCNVGFAESYVCKDDDNTTSKVETTIWERYSKDKFLIRTEDDQKLYFDKYYEDRNVIVLFVVSPNTKGNVGTLILNKNDLTFGGSLIFHPFDDYKIDDFNSGKCRKIN